MGIECSLFSIPLMYMDSIALPTTKKPLLLLVLFSLYFFFSPHKEDMTMGLASKNRNLQVDSIGVDLAPCRACVHKCPGGLQLLPALHLPCCCLSSAS